LFTTLITDACLTYSVYVIYHLPCIFNTKMHKKVR